MTNQMSRDQRLELDRIQIRKLPSDVAQMDRQRIQACNKRMLESEWQPNLERGTFGKFTFHSDIAAV